MSIVDDIVLAAEQSSEFRKFKDTFKAAGVTNWLQPKEMALHFGIGAFLPGTGTIAEIGAFEGASALFTARGLKVRGRGRLYSIDPHFGTPPYLGAAPYQFTYEKFKRNGRSCAVDEYIQSMVSDSVSAAAVWPAMPIDSVLIDGDHSYLGALRDFECWAPKLRKDGLVLIDDADDAALPELLALVAEIKGMGSMTFETMVGGIAVFRNIAEDPFSLLRELDHMAAQRTLRRPWSLEFVQSLQPSSNYKPELVEADLRTAYQFGFLSRCEPGDYGVAAGATRKEFALAEALATTRGDGQVLTLDPRGEALQRCRLIIAPIEDIPDLARHLLPGGVMIGCSSLEPTYANAVSERRILLASKLEACGWSGKIHWGVARPHHLSMDAILEYISASMN